MCRKSSSPSALEGDRPASRWEIEVVKSPPSQLERIRFPRVGGLRSQPQECLAVPTWTGRLCDTPRELLAGEKQAGRRLEWSYPGELSLQCGAWYREGGPGLYLACNDTSAHRKSLAFWGTPAAQVNGEMVHLPEGQAAGLELYRLPYQVLLETFAGDWFTAAQRYRAWGREQTWSRASRLRQGIVPAWVVETGAWVWNRGRSDGVLPPALLLQQEAGLAGAGVLALVARLCVRRRFSRVLSTTRGHNRIPKRSGRRQTCRHPRHGLHEPAAVGHVDPQLD